MIPITHNFLKKFPIHKACKIDAFRPALEYIQFKDGYAYCSEGHIAIRARISDISTNFDDVDIKKLNGKCLHFQHYADLLKFKYIAINDDYIEAIDRSSSPIRFFFDTTKDRTYPNIKKVFEDSLCAKSKEEETKIGVRVDFLQTLSKAMKCDYLSLSRNNGMHAIILDHLDRSVDIKGLIMPVFDVDD